MQWKALTPLNWRDTDPCLAVLSRIGPDGVPLPMSADDWADQILDVNLSQTAPERIRALFDVARGSILYGCFFYPLFALGMEGIYRTAEAAIAEVCEKKGIASGESRFIDRLEALKANGLLSDVDHDRWTALRKLRNEASHPEKPTLLPPGAVLGLLWQITADINALFT